MVDLMIRFSCFTRVTLLRGVTAATLRRGVALCVAVLLASAASAQTLTGTASVRVDAAELVQQIDANTARLEAAAAERQEIRQAIASLAQAQATAPTQTQVPVPLQAPTPNTPADADPNAPAEHPPAQGADAPSLDDGLPLSPLGFTVFSPSPDTRVIYVSAQGNDRNTGLSPDAPLRSPQAGYQKLRDGKPDWLLFKAGETFESNLGNLTKSGRSVNEPQLIGVYGPPEAGRPVLRCPRGSWAFKPFNRTANHLAFVGLHVVAINRDPAQPGFDAAKLGRDQWHQSAIQVMGAAQNILVEDCVFDYFKFALVFQSDENAGWMRNVRLRRCVVRNSYGHHDEAVAGHSSGAYIEYVDGLRLEECLFDHNGWNPDVQGARRTKFNHNVYIQSNCQNIDIRRSIFTRGASHGVQVRPGGVVEDSLFVRNALAFFVGRNVSRVENNVVLHSDDIGPDEPRGYGISTNPGLHNQIIGNILAQKLGRAGHAPAIDIGVDKNSTRWLDGRAYRVTLKDNKVYQWPRSTGDRSAIGVQARDVQIANLGGNQLDAVSGGPAGVDLGWPDPGRDVESYMDSLGLEASLEAFLERVANRPRGTWDPAFSAPAVNEYVRQGFTPRP